ncbi:hypothetical protein PYW07_014852 [Mythimna separata]|uniref:Uncharacterized protein n=1 Tax=Mythimna separata TaxID=271217 RepID=A0AAD7Z0A8_MYTSE|nr:hypothetical protein PYW07_014852 [Mythimna separata]
MAMCYQKHPFEIETEDRLTTINTKIFEIKKKIQLSEGQRKSNFEENEAEKQQNNDLIDTLKKEIKMRLTELAQARAVIGEEEVQIKKYLNEVCPMGDKSADKIIHNLDLKVTEQRKILDLLKYEKRNKKRQLAELEKEYEHLLIENNKGILVKSKNSSKARKHVSHLENEIHKVLIQWTEAELVKKKYISIRQALLDDSVKFESSLTRIEDLLKKQKEEIMKLERIREEAAEMRIRATAATAAEAALAHDAEHSRASERAYFAQRFAERKRELEKLEKRVFPPQARPVVRQESTRSTEGETVPEELSASQQMEDIFQRLMKLTGVTDAEEVFDRFRAQRDTSQRLSYLQQTTEEEKLQLEQTQATMMAELEAFKFASVKDKDEAQDQITALKEEIAEENDIYAELEKNIDELETLLLEIKRLLYELCKLLDVSIVITALKEEIAEENEIYAELEKNIDELETLLLEIKRLLYELCKLLDVSIVITALKEEIAEENEIYAELEKNIDELETLLLEIKRLLYELCKLLDVSIVITALKEEIAEENEIYAELEKNIDELETLLLEIKRLLYELCKLLDVSIVITALEEEIEENEIYAELEKNIDELETLLLEIKRLLYELCKLLDRRIERTEIKRLPYELCKLLDVSILITAVEEEIAEENEIYAELEKNIDELETLLLEIKRLLYELCKLLDVSIVITAVEEEIAEENEIYAELEKNIDELETLLLEIKRLLYELCKLLDVSIVITAVEEEIAEENEIYAELEKNIDELETLLLEIKRLLYELCKLLDLEKNIDELETLLLEIKRLLYELCKLLDVSIVITAVEEEIAEENEIYAELEKNIDELETLLLEIKRLLYELCKLLDLEKNIDELETLLLEIKRLLYELCKLLDVSIVITAVEEEIAEENEIYAELEKNIDELETLLLEIKRLLYELCKLLDLEKNIDELETLLLEIKRLLYELCKLLDVSIVITAVEEEIEENEIYAELEKNIEELETLLLEIKRLLYELCKLLDIIPEPSMPEWTAEARDVQELVTVLTVRYEKARTKAEDIKEKQKDTTIIMVPSTPASAAASVAGMSGSQSTPKESEKNVPTYKELLQKEPVKAQRGMTFHHPEKNAYLQLVCPLDPRIINKTVRYAMRKKYTRRPDEKNIKDILPSARKLESEQPSLSMACVDVTVARLGFERLGLKILIRELNSHNKLVKLQAIHTLLDQVQIPESVYFLLDHHVVYRLIELMPDNDPIVREKVAIILTRLSNFLQGRTLIMTRPIVIDHLINMITQDRKELRYAASLCIKTLTRTRCACEIIMQNEKIIESLLKMIKHDYMEIVLYHLNSLKNLSEWDPIPALKANAFQVMLKLLIYHHYRVVQAAMDVMSQLCKHSVGKKLADNYDVNDRLMTFLISPNIQVVVSTLNLMQFTTNTPRSLWRAKQYTFDIVKRLVALAVSQSIPILQMRAMQVLVNLCDCSDIRIELKTHWEGVITKNVKICPYEAFEGTSEMTTFGLACGYNYQTMGVETVDAIRADYGDSVQPEDVYSCLSRMTVVKQKLLKAMNVRKDKD